MKRLNPLHFCELPPLFFRFCPNCGHDGLAEHGGGLECLICGYDSARDEVRTPGEWLRDAAAQVDAEARGLHRLVETPRGWRLAVNRRREGKR